MLLPGRCGGTATRLMCRDMSIGCVNGDLVVCLNRMCHSSCWWGDCHETGVF